MLGLCNTCISLLPGITVLTGVGQAGAERRGRAPEGWCQGEIKAQGKERGGRVPQPHGELAPEQPGQHWALPAGCLWRDAPRVYITSLCKGT